MVTTPDPYEHKAAYVFGAGNSSNQTEGVLDRTGRDALGIYHLASGRYVNWYVGEWAWRHDLHRQNLRTLTPRLTRMIKHIQPSHNMTGYWQATVVLPASRDGVVTRLR